MLVNIIRAWDDHEPVVLGAVGVSLVDPVKIKDEIEEAWDLFQETEPDSDNDFIDWMIKTCPELFHEVPQPIETLSVSVGA